MKRGCRFWKTLRVSLENETGSLSEESRNHLRICSDCRTRFYETTMADRCLRELTVRYGREIVPVMDFEKLSVRRTRASLSIRTKYAVFGGVGLCLAFVALLLHQTAPRPVAVVRPEKRINRTAVVLKTVAPVYEAKHVAAGHGKATVRNMPETGKKEACEKSLEMWLDRSVSLLIIPDNLQGFFDSSPLENDGKI